jgi:hypothetical protein
VKLRLPSVTLVVQETRLHKLAAMAAESCIAAVDFGDVLVASNDFTEFDFPARFHRVEDWPDKLGTQLFAYNETCYPLVQTSHKLVIEWDSWVVRPEAWTDEFLEYDFVGAPWGYDEHNVGNGGFSLRSTALTQCLRDNKDLFPFDSSNADDTLCRLHRPKLERLGFKWAPDELARRFSFERYARPEIVANAFGFHGMFNWDLVLRREKLIERMKAAQSFPYVVDNPYMWGELVERDPTLLLELERRSAAA